MYPQSSLTGREETDTHSNVKEDEETAFETDALSPDYCGGKKSEGSVI
jgi:hypothetical protein